MLRVELRAQLAIAPITSTLRLVEPPIYSFASTWGELIEHQDMPKSTEEAIETKKKQLEALKSSSGTQIGGLGIPLYQSAAQATMSQTASLVQSGADPEGHLKKAYRVMRAGV